MNITELARILRVSPLELRQLLPQMGFNIGQKAIKVDKMIAKKIIKNWPIFMAQIERQRQADEALRREQEGSIEKEIKKVEIGKFVTVKELASLADLPVNSVLKELMKNGVFVSMNEKIDFDSAVIIGDSLGLDVSLKENDESLASDNGREVLAEAIRNEKGEELKLRPPVIVVMGHVDHGKTKLLDAIRATNVVAGESGGITQHIGAYQVEKNNKKITFIDTPGHEAFTAMRSRGARVADIAILVVAADDGVKPQTVEAFRIIEASKVPFIVAINKIDKEGADINRTKQELSSQLNIIPEDWGGKIVCAPISALEGQGIEELLDLLLLTSEMEEENLQANPLSEAIGTVIESNIDKGAGPVVTLLVQNGTLKVGDQLCFNGVIYGKVKALKNYKGENVESALPSMPVRILGLKILPEVGDILQVGEGEKVKIKKMISRSHPEQQASSNSEIEDDSFKLNLIIKSDFLGSAEAIEESLMKINTKKIKVKIIHKGLGNIGEGDVKRAEDSNAQIVGFNVKLQPQTEDLVREKGIKINIFSIIYDLIKYVKAEMKSVYKPEIIRKDLGKLKVMAIFRTENDSQIIGGRVIEGSVENNSLLEIWREDNFIDKGKIEKLQSGKQDVPVVENGQECGVKYIGHPVVAVGDVLYFYKEEESEADL
ncbi:MAG: translation initiation factor IF-2 [Patescibacteria group bacterium]|nr:translation initiation factor IF-2 [Patescibacteria group bacterium]